MAEKGWTTEGEKDPGWSVGTAREHVLDIMEARLTRIDDMMVEADKRYEQRFRAQEQALSQALDAAREATTKLEHQTNERFRSVNEFRGALQDQAARFAERGQVDANLTAINERLSDLSTRMVRVESAKSERRDAGLETRDDSRMTLQRNAFMLSLIPIAVSVITLVLVLSR